MVCEPVEIQTCLILSEVKLLNNIKGSHSSSWFRVVIGEKHGLKKEFSV